MKFKLYSLRDIKADYFANPFVSENNETAQRMVENMFKDPQAQQSQYVINPQDFELYCLGDFDNNTGEITSGSDYPPKPIKILDLSKFQKVD